MLDASNRSRDALPSLSHLGVNVHKSEKIESSSYPTMTGLSISMAPPESPNTIYAGPPPPYSTISTTAEPAHSLSGYLSPPKSTTRRSTRGEQESPAAVKSLPSIHEALGDKTMPLATNQPHFSSLPPVPTVGQTLPNAPSGPPNPFSQSVTTSTTSRDPVFPYTLSSGFAPANDSQPPKSGSLININHERSVPAPPPFTYPGSPHDNTSPSHRFPNGNAYPGTSSNVQSIKSPRHPGPPRRDHSFSDRPPQHITQTQQPSNLSQPAYPFHFEPNGNFDNTRNPFTRNSHEHPYGETVKRHLDVFDAELALNEIRDASSRTFEFSRNWLQIHHQCNRSVYAQDGIPSLNEIDEMMRQSHRVMESLNRIRDVVVMQENALSEQRARAGVSSQMDESLGLADDYKSGGFAGGDAKKRRGKAAPPGRCHSCNRAETPEWRRGPDGARTLCNACGLHYAKLTRKIGANKANALTGSSLRSKSHDHRTSLS